MAGEKYTDNPNDVIKNYDFMSLEDKILAEEKVYKKQMKSKEIDKTLQEIIERQRKEREEQ